ncbi:MAG TPA: phytanoyl-CoA dioxygenase family protein [Candidatus Latescibacteria bacterium]|jgi:phytanoyl-CoA hydroxylase|nr:phytanoyl-CoA dioxygenase family protein [Candidatus Latescibacterota bacterium]
MSAAVDIWTYPRITDEQVDSYSRDGFLVIENALSPKEVEELRNDTVSICRGEWGEVGNLPEFGPNETDEEIQQQVLCIHQIHKISPIMHRYLAQRTMKDVLTSVIGPNVKCMQSMLFIKAAGKPGQAWHQDETYIPTRDRSLTGGWIALDDATVENGCLYVIPGSHASGVLWPQREHDDRRFDCAHETYQFPYSDVDAIPVEVGAGAIVFFNGYLLHRSFPNHAESGFRRVLVNHYMSAESFLPWHVQESVGQAKADHRDIVMIAGTDPYEYKGIVDVTRPQVRSSGEGGCGDRRRSIKAATSL